MLQMSEFLKRVYSEIAGYYEKIDHIFTLGLDIYWRRCLVKMALKDCGGTFLDVCTGTGETARLIVKLSTGPAKVVGTDFSSEMLDEARRLSKGDIEYKLSDTSSLPFPEGSFDAVTMSFAARNLNSGEMPLVDYFKEIYRVLKKGGAFFNLETSHPTNRLVRFFFRMYVGGLVALVGRRFSGNEEGYRYLVSSVLTFMGPDELAEKLKEAGFTRVEYVKYLSGVVAIHRAVKTLGSGLPI